MSLLHDIGITVTYDEVLRFRTSAAIYTGSQPYTLRGLNVDDGGELASWIDNYDLNIATPNGCRETHALVVEVTHQPTNDVDQEDETDSNTSHPIIPRVSLAEMSNAKLSELSPIEVQHYDGPKNPLPPVVNVHSGVPYDVVTQRMDDVSSALKADLDWLTNIAAHDDDTVPAEWSGHMTYLARENGFVAKATKYMYGPLIDSPPSHPDTVLTSLVI